MTNCSGARWSKSSCVVVSLSEVDHHAQLLATSISSVESQKGAINIQRCSVWEPERHHRHSLCTAIAPFWFSRGYIWVLITPFWLSNSDIFSVMQRSHRHVNLSRIRATQGKWRELCSSCWVYAAFTGLRGSSGHYVAITGSTWQFWALLGSSGLYVAVAGITWQLRGPRGSSGLYVAVRALLAVRALCGSSGYTWQFGFYVAVRALRDSSGLYVAVTGLRGA